MSRSRLFALAVCLVARVASADPVPHPEKVIHLTGVDGSRVRVTLRSDPGSPPMVRACLLNSLSSGQDVGLSVAANSATPVPANAVHCLSLAPTHQVFVLWHFLEPQGPRRSISYSVDLTRWARHVLWFEWEFLR